MKKTWTRLAGVGLAAAMAVPQFAACTADSGPCGGDPTQLHEDRAWTSSSGACDNVFNPFFATSLYDSNVVGQTQIALLGSDPDGEEVTYGVDEHVVALDYN